MKNNFLFLTVFILLFFSSCTICNNEIIKQDYLSCNSKIILFSRDAGATTNTSYQISIIGNKTKLGNKKGNICITNGTYLDYIIEYNSIFIIYNGELFLGEEKYKNMNIYYEKL